MPSGVAPGSWGIQHRCSYVEWGARKLLQSWSWAETWLLSSGIAEPCEMLVEIRWECVRECVGEAEFECEKMLWKYPKSITGSQVSIDRLIIKLKLWPLTSWGIWHRALSKKLQCDQTPHLPETAWSKCLQEHLDRHSTAPHLLPGFAISVV